MLNGRVHAAHPRLEHSAPDQGAGGRDKPGPAREPAMNLSHFSFDVDADGIALAIWDMPGRSMNVITLEVMDELSEIVERVASDAAIKGCVIASGKESFSGG